LASNTEGALNDTQLDVEYRRAVLLQERGQYVEAGKAVAQLLVDATGGTVLFPL
jgi:hypothetical protein